MINAPQLLVAGLWFYVDEKSDPFYIGHVQHDTAVLLRKIVKDGITYTDSHHALFHYLKGIPLDYNTLVDRVGFLPSTEREGYVLKELVPKLQVLRGDYMEQVKPALNLFIDIDESGKRFTTYLECGLNKIFLPELSFIHELQLLIYTHTYKFPLLEITKRKEIQLNENV